MFDATAAAFLGAQRADIASGVWLIVYFDREAILQGVLDFLVVVVVHAVETLVAARERST